MATTGSDEDQGHLRWIELQGHWPHRGGGEAFKIKTVVAITELLKNLNTMSKFSEKCKSVFSSSFCYITDFSFFLVVSDIAKLSKYHVDFMAASDLQNDQQRAHSAELVNPINPQSSTFVELTQTQNETSTFTFIKKYI